MSKNAYIKVLIFLTFTNLIWAFGYAYVGDTYPELATLKQVLELKAIASWLIVMFGWLLLPVALQELNDE